MRGLRALVDKVTRRRTTAGSPWERAQTDASLRSHLLAEARSVVEAIDRGDDAALRSELGELVYVVAMLAQLAAERGAFTLHDVVERAGHGLDPHDPRPAEPSATPAPTEGLPALRDAQRISERAAALGFDWPDVAGVRAKVDEELAELDEAIHHRDPEAIGEELGDLLFTLVNLGRHLPVSAERALRSATAKFARRFSALEAHVAQRGGRVRDASAEALEAAWAAVKEAT